MKKATEAVVFFELSSALAAIRESDRKWEIAIYPGVEKPLAVLADDDVVRLGVVSGRETPDEEAIADALRPAGLLELIDRDLILVAPTLRAALRRAETRTSSLPRDARDPPRLVFVGENPEDRAVALGAGFLVSPHPVLAPEVLRGAALRYVQVRVPPWQVERDWKAALRKLPVVPMYVRLAGEGRDAPAVLAIASPMTSAALDDLGFQVTRLGYADDPQRTELYFVRDDEQERTGFLSPEGCSSAFFAGRNADLLLASTAEGLLVALPAGRSVEAFHFTVTPHGHNRRLGPSMALLASPPASEGLVSAMADPAFTLAPELSADEVKAIRVGVTAAGLQEIVDRYTGVVEVDGRRIRSRHIENRGNGWAATALESELKGVGGLQVWTHTFNQKGHWVANVEAVLPGTGKDGIVLVGAHLDSTAKLSSLWDSVRDTAPGADDDASGMAGVLAIAHTLAGMTGLAGSRREIRFLLFNAEEQGLVGSQIYAGALGLPPDGVVGMFQLDMIGYDQGPGPKFELHAGNPDGGEVEQRSVALAGLVMAAVRQLGLLLEPQLLPSAEHGPDLAIGRSDHSSFHAARYPAVLVSEDCFAVPQEDADFNPAYHTRDDTAINKEYAEKIVQAVAAAAWMAATR